MNAVLIRLDKIGDLVSTLACDEIAELKNYQITWVISKGMSFVAENALPKRTFIELDKSKSWNSFWSLLKLLKSTKPSLVISFQAPWWVSLAMWLAQVPVRVGRLSQWHSFLFFNQGLRQQRSQSLKHEADYNAELVYHAFNKTKNSTIKPTFARTHTPQALATPILQMQAPIDTELLTRYQLNEKQYFIIHPGMAGSALNWQVKHYLQLITELLNDNYVVAVTGTSGDEAWLSEIKKSFHNHKNFRNLQNQLKPTELLTVLAQARAVFAPSTGVLHLSAALGTPSVGIYSPVLSQKSVRWRARGKLVNIFEPIGINCPATHSCQGSPCKLYHCLDQITVSQIKNALLDSQTHQSLSHNQTT